MDQTGPSLRAGVQILQYVNCNIIYLREMFFRNAISAGIDHVFWRTMRLQRDKVEVNNLQNAIVCYLQSFFVNGNLMTLPLLCYLNIDYSLWRRIAFHYCLFDVCIFHLTFLRTNMTDSPVSRSGWWCALQIKTLRFCSWLEVATRVICVFFLAWLLYQFMENNFMNMSPGNLTTRGQAIKPRYWLPFKCLFWLAM